jgi:hypothetical protein
MPNPPDSLLPNSLPASARILHMGFTALVIARAVYVAAKLGIPDLLQDRRLRSEELAQATGTPPSVLYRLLRAVRPPGRAGAARSGVPSRPRVAPRPNRGPRRRHPLLARTGAGVTS